MSTRSNRFTLHVAKCKSETSALCRVHGATLKLNFFYLQVSKTFYIRTAAFSKCAATFTFNNPTATPGLNWVVKRKTSKLAKKQTSKQQPSKLANTKIFFLSTQSQSLHILHAVCSRAMAPIPIAKLNLFLTRARPGHVQ